MTNRCHCTCFYKLFDLLPFNDTNQKEQMAKVSRLYDEAKFLIEAKLPSIIDTDQKREAIELARIAKEALTDDKKEWEYRKHGLKVIEGPHNCLKLHLILETIADILEKARDSTLITNPIQQPSNTPHPTEQTQAREDHTNNAEPALSEMGKKVADLIDQINENISKRKKPEVEMKYGPIPAIREVITQSDIKFPILKHKADQIDQADKKALAQYLRSLANFLDGPEVSTTNTSEQEGPKPSPQQTPTAKINKSRNKPFDITSLKKRKIAKHQTRGDKLMLSVEGTVEGSSLIISKPVTLADAIEMDQEMVLNYLKAVKKRGSNSYNSIVKNNFDILKKLPINKL